MSVCRWIYSLTICAVAQAAAGARGADANAPNSGYAIPKALPTYHGIGADAKTLELLNKGGAKSAVIYIGGWASEKDISSGASLTFDKTEPELQFYVYPHGISGNIVYNTDSLRSLLRDITTKNPGIEIDFIVSSRGILPLAKLHPEFESIGIKNRTYNIIANNISTRLDVAFEGVLKGSTGPKSIVQFLAPEEVAKHFGEKLIRSETPAAVQKTFKACPSIWDKATQTHVSPDLTTEWGDRGLNAIHGAAIGMWQENAILEVRRLIRALGDDYAKIDGALGQDFFTTDRGEFLTLPKVIEDVQRISLESTARDEMLNLNQALKAPNLNQVQRWAKEGEMKKLQEAHPVLALRLALLGNIELQPVPIGSMPAKYVDNIKDWDIHDLGSALDGSHWVLVGPKNQSEQAALGCIPILLTKEGADPNEVAKAMNGMAQRISRGKPALMLLYGDAGSADNQAKIAALKLLGYGEQQIMVLGSNGNLYSSTGALRQAGYTEKSGTDKESALVNLAKAAYKLQKQTGLKVVADPVNKSNEPGPGGASEKGSPSILVADPSVSGVSIQNKITEASFERNTNLQPFRRELLNRFRLGATNGLTPVAR